MSNEWSKIKEIEIGIKHLNKELYVTSFLGVKEKGPDGVIGAVITKVAYTVIFLYMYLFN
ncbi:hypothetical protein [Staphylococcus coagulans]|uniref:hypothetical protein n=1 Tax=Staphylococcus coagulans TaxID=74706 RepID=UPI0030EB4C0A